MDKSARKEIEKKLGYRFKKRDLLELALLHPSYRHENPDAGEDNQRLEFLGDAALGLAAASDLYAEFSEHNEGSLTQMRSRLANRSTLAALARDLKLGDYLLLGRGEERSGGRQRASNLTDAMEAVIGAVYLDGGQKAVQKIFRRLWADELNRQQADEIDNPKGRLQEYCQKKWKVSPSYRVTSETGPSHAKEFVCVAYIKGEAYGTGYGSNKRDAEMAAARETLKQWSLV